VKPSYTYVVSRKIRNFNFQVLVLIVGDGRYKFAFYKFFICLK